MPLDTKLSFALSSLLAVTTLAVTQAFKTQLAESKSMTIVGGGVGSIFFLFLITAIGNGESLMFGKGFELQFVPEVVFALAVSCAVAGSIHRVSITCCLAFSLTILYFMNIISQQVHAVPEVPVKQSSKKRR